MVHARVASLASPVLVPHAHRCRLLSCWQHLRCLRLSLWSHASLHRLRCLRCPTAPPHACAVGQRRRCRLCRTCSLRCRDLRHVSATWIVCCTACVPCCLTLVRRGTSPQKLGQNYGCSGTGWRVSGQGSRLSFTRLGPTPHSRRQSAANPPHDPHSRLTPAT